LALGDCGGEGRIGGFVGQVHLAGEEADEGSAFFGAVVADGSGEDGEARFERIEQHPLGHGRIGRG